MCLLSFNYLVFCFFSCNMYLYYTLHILGPSPLSFSFLWPELHWQEWGHDQLLALPKPLYLPWARPVIPTELRRHKPSVLSITMGNVRELRWTNSAHWRRHRGNIVTAAWCASQRRGPMQTSCVLTWLQHCSCGQRYYKWKRKGGRITMFWNEWWCNPGHLTVKEHRCNSDIVCTFIFYLLWWSACTSHHQLFGQLPMTQSDCGCPVTNQTTRSFSLYYWGLQSCLSGAFHLSSSL